MYKARTRYLVSKTSERENQNPNLGFKIRICILKTEFVFYRVIDILIIFKQSQHQDKNPHLVFEIRIWFLKSVFVF